MFFVTYLMLFMNPNESIVLNDEKVETCLFIMLIRQVILILEIVFDKLWKTTNNTHSFV